MPDAAVRDCVFPHLPQSAQSYTGERSTRNPAVSHPIAGPGNSSHKTASRAGKGGVLFQRPDVKSSNRKKEFSSIMRPKKVILCVDDNEQELSVLKFMLATNGYKVVSASTGQEAIGVFNDIQVDLVLADFAMPQMNGSELVNRLKQIVAHVPMILLGDPQKMGGDLHGADALLANKNCT